MKIGKVFKTGITEVGNPYTPGIAFGNRVLAALDHIYVREGKVFEGSIDDHIKWADEKGISEQEIRASFQEMEESGWVTINGDTFTPIDWLINRYR